MFHKGIPTSKRRTVSDAEKVPEKVNSENKVFDNRDNKETQDSKSNENQRQLKHSKSLEHIFVKT